MICEMRKSSFSWIWVLFLYHSSVYAAVQITSIDFNGINIPNEINIQANGPLSFLKQDNAADKQVVIELKGVTITPDHLNKIDTSSFDSNVSMISPYLVEGESETVRIVIQLREFVLVEVSQDGNLVRVRIPKSVGPLSTIESKKKDLLDEFIDNQKSKKFIGKPITLQIRDLDISDVLRLIGEASGFNIVMGDDVKGKMTLSLVQVPWDQALDLVLRSMHLGAERSNNILRIASLQSLTSEKIEESKAKAAVDANAPRITRVFPISYADLSELKTTLLLFSSGSKNTSSPPGLESIQASIVQEDKRTNSIIVRDIPESLERIKKLIEILDTQTPQVMIEAKIIEATEEFSKTHGGSLGVGGSGDYFGRFARGNPLTTLMGNPTQGITGIFNTTSDFANISAPTSGGGPASNNGTFGLSPNLSFIPGLSKLNAILSWGETEHQVKVISSPKTVVLNKEKASITEGTPVSIPGATTITTAGPVTSNSVQQANIGLDVTPTVTNDGSVLLKLKVTRDVPMSPGIGSRTLETVVLVESGTTLVIGGVYTMSTSHIASGIPYLRSIPLIGALFGSEADQTQRTEIFFFITPRVLNLKEAGLSN